MLYEGSLEFCPHCRWWFVTWCPCEQAAYAEDMRLQHMADTLGYIDDNCGD